jgi:hypothetical protein
VAARKAQATLTGAPGSEAGLAFTPDGRRLAAGTGLFNAFGEVWLWDVPARKVVQRKGFGLTPPARLCYLLGHGSPRIVLWLAWRPLMTKTDRQQALPRFQQFMNRFGPLREDDTRVARADASWRGLLLDADDNQHAETLALNA